MRITIAAVGKIKEKYLTMGIAEFTKRMGPFCKLSIVEVDEEKLPDRPSDAERAQALVKEGERLDGKQAPEEAFAGLQVTDDLQ